MSSNPITIIAAMSRNRVIGRDGDLPWRLPRDLQFFMQTTMGHSLIMGRRTYESLKGPLKGRTIIVLSRQALTLSRGILLAPGLEEGLALVPEGQTPFIAGGAEIYRLSLPLADRMLLTLVQAEVEGDTFFPEFDQTEWHLTQRVDWPADEANAFPISFLDFVRTG